MIEAIDLNDETSQHIDITNNDIINDTTNGASNEYDETINNTQYASLYLKNCDINGNTAEFNGDIVSAFVDNINCLFNLNALFTSMRDRFNCNHKQ